MYFGAHVSAAGGIDKVPERAHAIGAECVQFFLNSPHGGTRTAPTTELADAFKRNCEKYKIHSSWIHAPYFINLASKNNRIYYGSISAIKKDLLGASLIGADGVIMHLGSARDFSEDEYDAAIAKAVGGIGKILEGYSGSAKLVLEISAGAGRIIGSSLEEMAQFLTQCQGVGGFCLDTAHAFESGWELRGAEAVKQLVDKIEKMVGMDKLALIHCNDSKSAFASHKDRHEHLGQGEIGSESFAALVDDKRLAGVDYILETPTEEGIIKDLELLKGFRKKLKI